MPAPPSRSTRARRPGSGRWTSASAVTVPPATPTSSRRRCSTAAAGAATPAGRDRDTGSLNGLAVLPRQRHVHRRGQSTRATRDCTGAVTRETRFQYAVSAGSAVTPPPGKLLTRKPDSFVINTFPLGVTLNPGAISYEIRYARNGVVQPDGSLGGTPKSAFVDTTSGLANFSFDEARPLPDRRARRARTASSRAGARRQSSTRSRRSTSRSVKFPDRKGPSYKLRGQIREQLRARQGHDLPRQGQEEGQVPQASARRRSARRGASRSASRSATLGAYRLRYIYRGNSTVAAGRVTERIKHHAGASSSASSRCPARSRGRLRAPASAPAATARSCGGG